MVGGRFHQWKGRLQPEAAGYPFDNGPPFKTPVTGNPTTPVFPAGVTPPEPETQPGALKPAAQAGAA